jgi:hypothetical protein
MEEHGRGEGTGDSLGIGQKPGAFLPAGLVPVQAIPKEQGRGQELATSGTVEVVGVGSVWHLTLRSCSSLELDGSEWQLRVVYPKPADNSDRSKTGYNGLLSPPCKEAMP